MADRTEKRTEVSFKTRMERVNASFDQMEAERKNLEGQKAQLQKRMDEIAAEQLRLQGEYRLLQTMLSEQEEKEKGEDT